jgi:hypothetical protein
MPKPPKKKKAPDALREFARRGVAAQRAVDRATGEVFCHVPVPADLWRDVQRLAVELGVTRRALVVEALRARVKAG